MTAPVKLLVTRPQPDADRTASALRALGIEPVIAPMLEPMQRDGALPDAKTVSAIAFTSLNAVRFFAALDPDPVFFDLTVYAVGEATADAAREAGFKTAFAAEGTLIDLTALIARTHKAGTIFYPHARDLSGDLAANLAPHGIEIIASEIYAMEQATSLSADVATALQRGEIAGALFYSQRTAEAFATLLSGPEFMVTRTMLHCLCMSSKCAEPLLSRHFVRIGLADAPSHDAMMTLALAFTREQIRA